MLGMFLTSDRCLNLKVTEGRLSYSIWGNDMTFETTWRMKVELTEDVKMKVCFWVSSCFCPQEILPGWLNILRLSHPSAGETSEDHCVFIHQTEADFLSLILKRFYFCSRKEAWNFPWGEIKTSWLRVAKLSNFIFHYTAENNLTNH